MRHKTAAQWCRRHSVCRPCQWHCDRPASAPPRRRLPTQLTPLVAPPTALLQPCARAAPPTTTAVPPCNHQQDLNWKARIKQEKEELARRAAEVEEAKLHALVHSAGGRRVTAGKTHGPRMGAQGTIHLASDSVVEGMDDGGMATGRSGMTDVSLGSYRVDSGGALGSGRSRGGHRGGGGDGGVSVSARSRGLATDRSRATNRARGGKFGPGGGVGPTQLPGATGRSGGAASMLSIRTADTERAVVIKQRYNTETLKRRAAEGEAKRLERELAALKATMSKLDHATHA